MTFGSMQAHQQEFPKELPDQLVGGPMTGAAVHRR
jgi:hypothetical protein